jgi:hypothetical protein
MPEPIFLNVFGVQESMPQESISPAYVAWRAGTGLPCWKSIPRLLKRNTGSDLFWLQWGYLRTYILN